MGREHRRGARTPVSLNVTVILRDDRTNQPLAEPIMGSLRDLSCYGVRMSLPRIRSGNYHLFYAMSEAPPKVLNIEVIDPEEPGRLVIPVRPVWFDRILSTPARPFELGLEFLVGPDDPGVLRLHQLLSVSFKTGGGWLWDLFGFGRKAKNASSG